MHAWFPGICGTFGMASKQVAGSGLRLVKWNQEECIIEAHSHLEKCVYLSQLFSIINNKFEFLIINTLRMQYKINLFKPTYLCTFRPSGEGQKTVGTDLRGPHPPGRGQCSPWRPPWGQQAVRKSMPQGPSNPPSFVDPPSICYIYTNPMSITDPHVVQPKKRLETLNPLDGFSLGSCS